MGCGSRAADWPLGVVGVNEAGHGLAELFDAVLQLRPQALLLMPLTAPVTTAILGEWSATSAPSMGLPVRLAVSARSQSAGTALTVRPVLAAHQRLGRGWLRKLLSVG